MAPSLQSVRMQLDGGQREASTHELAVYRPPSVRLPSHPLLDSVKVSALFPTHRRALDILPDVLDSSLQPRNLCQQGIV